jgi:hypothetical protein
MRPGWDGSFLSWCKRASEAPAPRAAAGPGGAAASGRATPARESGSDYLRRMASEWDEWADDGPIINHEEEP